MVNQRIIPVEKRPGVKKYDGKIGNSNIRNSSDRRPHEIINEVDSATSNETRNDYSNFERSKKRGLYL